MRICAFLRQTAAGSASFPSDGSLFRLEWDRMQDFGRFCFAGAPFSVHFQERNEDIVMLSIQHLTIELKKEERIIVKDFCFTLMSGDRAAVIGEEGNGKSTLLKWIVCPKEVEKYCNCKGILQSNGLNLGYLEQMVPFYGDMTVRDYLKGIDLYGDLPVPLWELHSRMELFESNQPLSTLSGGEKLKIRLVKLLSQHPEVLLLDEPTNDLDLNTLKWLENFLLHCPMPVLYVSHDETLLENTANVVIHLEQVKKKQEARYTIQRTGYREYVETRLGVLEKQEQIARKQREQYEKQQQRFRQIYSKVEHEQKVITRQNPGGARLLKKKIHALKSQERRLERQEGTFEDIPSVEEAIGFSFSPDTRLPAGKRILDFSLSQLWVEDRVLARNLHLHVHSGEKVAIVGENGIGKTTLIKVLLKEVQATPGIRVGYMPQNYAELLPADITPVAFLAPSGEKERVTRVRTALGNLKFTHEEMLYPVGSLSGGQQAKLLLLHLGMEHCHVLVLDEPTRNFSPLSNPVIRKALTDYMGTILCVTHDRKFLKEVCTSVYELTPDGLSPSKKW